ncbi:MAG: non-homologous end-joining DNA ligase [Thermodesulfovibrionales bacterium]|nr:non-homologous end-joining DNA ligase [Thermodesulfovibrionales bacterium]
MDYRKLIIKPMLAMPSTLPFDSEKYVFELKWDGTRCIAFIDKNVVRLQNRRLLDISGRYPEFKNLQDSIKIGAAILDGEIVILHKGKPDFERLQQREHIEDRLRIKLLSETMPATYIVFDILYLKDKSLMDLSLMRRKNILKENLNPSELVIISEHYEKGRELYNLALKKGFEGIMAKDKESPYLEGRRSSYWLKIKKSNDIDAVICGILEGRKKSVPLGSLILGLYRNGELIHIGQVGTGFNEEEIQRILKITEKLYTSKPAFKVTPYFKRKVQWLIPELVAKIKFLEWTKDGKLRSPVFVHLRFDKPPHECELKV